MLTVGRRFLVPIPALACAVVLLAGCSGSVAGTATGGSASGQVTTATSTSSGSAGPAGSTASDTSTVNGSGSAESTDTVASTSTGPGTSVLGSNTDNSAGSSSASAPADSSTAGSNTAGTSVAALKAITVQPADVPEGYTGAAYQADPTDAADQAALVKCVGGTDTSRDVLAKADSDDYTLQNAEISSQAQSFKSQADLAADLAIITSPKVSGCYDMLFKTLLASSLPPGSTITSVAISITPGNSGGPPNVVGTGSGKLTVKSQSQTIDVYVDVAFITGPLIEAEVDFTNVGSPIPVAVRTAIINKVAARAASA